MSSVRLERLRSLLKQEVCAMLQREIKDPRLTAFITVTNVKISSDLSHAKVFISVMGSDEEKNLTMKTLDHAKNYIRTTIGKRINVKYTPLIEFCLDETIEKSLRINQILERLNSDNENREGDR